MTDFEEKLLEEIQSLRAEISAMRSETSISQITFFENLDQAAVVGTDYVAFRFNCSKTAVIRGRFETDQIPRLRKKPLAFIKRDVDSVWRNLNRSASDKAAEL